MSLLVLDNYGFRSERAKDLRALAVVLAANSREALSKSDSHAAQEVVDALASDDRVVSAAMFDASGRMFASFQRARGEATRVRPDANETSLRRGGYIEQSEPITLGGKFLGSISIASDPAEVRRRASRYAVTLCILLPAAILLVAPFIRRMSGGISKPLRDLAWTAKLITLRHDYSVRAAKETDDEVGHLVDSFNQMLGEIESRAELLRENNADLEARVMERTKELQAEVIERRDAEARRSAIVEAALDGLVGTDAEGRIIEFNPAAERMYGYSKRAVLGKLFYDCIVPSRLREFCKGDFTSYINERKSDVVGRHVELAGLRADGSEFPIEIAVTDFSEKISGSSPTVMSAFIRDITERKRAEAELQRAKETAEAASRTKSEFLANMSHEIRTPMNGILGMTDLALDTELSEEQREYLELVKSSAASLLEVINDILDFSKVESGKLEIACEKFALRAAVDQVIRSFAHRAEKKGLELSTAISDDVPNALIGDDGRLKQVLINLIGNAIKFTAHGGVTLTVSAESHGGARTRLHFSVADSGIGISPEQQSRIFEPFMQADGSTTRKYGGTGLGLTISARLVELMNGKMWLESNPGAGSNFQFTIQCDRAAEPISEEKEPPAEAHSQAKGSPDARFRNLRILVVEDNPVNRKVAVRFLERYGHTVEIAENGLQALQCLRASGAREFDVILMDVQMPEMDGIEATKQIRENERIGCGHQPIIAMTAHAMTGDRQRCLTAGMDGYVSKPVRATELQHEIERVLAEFPKYQPHTGQDATCVPSSLAEPARQGIAPAEVFDAEALRERVQGNAELLEELVHIFLDDLPKRVDEIRRAVMEMNLARIERAAHTLKGTAALMSASRLASVARELEISARENRRERFPELFARVIAEAEQLKTEIAPHRCEVEA